MNYLIMTEYFDDDEYDSISYAEEQQWKIQKEKEYWSNSIEGD